MNNGNSIIIPRINNNKYNYLVLENMLEVLFVSNDYVSDCSLSLTVNVGFYNDPKDYQGLAHFLEHMLFMGTQKYPKENYFHEFINKVNGYTNAGTGKEFTTYYFNVLEMYFPEALEIFSHFFISPLLLQSSIDKEINSIESEYNNNYLVDSTREHALLKEVMDNQQHPFYNFGVGSNNILHKPNIRNELIKFFNQFYSANLMKLVVMYNSSNTNNTNIVALVTKYYGQIPNKNYKLPTINTVPFNSFKSIVTKSLKQDDKLIMYWQLPKIQNYNDYKIGEFLSYLLGNESYNSLYSLFNKQHLIVKLNSEIIEDDSSIQLLSLKIWLTKEGIQSINTIISIINIYINIIKNSIEKNPNEIIKLYKEQKQINQIKFDYMEPLSSSMEISSVLSINMIQYSIQDVLFGPFKYTWDTNTLNLIKYYVNILNNNNNMIIVKSFSNCNTDDFSQEEYYKIPYKVTSINYNYNIFENSYTSSALNHLGLPSSNDYIPKNIKLYNNNNNLVYDENIKIFYKSNLLNSAKVYYNLILYNDNIYSTPKNYLLWNIYFNMLKQTSKSELFYAKICDTGFDFKINRMNIIITFYGYNSNIKIVIDYILEKLLNFKFNENDFTICKNKIMKTLESSKYKQPYEICMDYLVERLYFVSYSTEQLLIELNNITIANLDIIRNMIKNSLFKAFYYGNINTEYVLNLHNSINNNIRKNIIGKQDIKQYDYCRVSPLENGEQHIYIKKYTNSLDNNMAVVVFFEFDKITNYISNKNVGIYMILNNILEEKFFTQLRSNEQTGYIVTTKLSNVMDSINTLYGISFIVQSNKLTPNIVRKMIKKFINSMEPQINSLDQKTLSQHIKILTQKLSINHNTNNEDMTNYLERIISNKFIDKRKLIYQGLSSITLQDIKLMFHKSFINSTTRKIRIVELYRFHKD